MALRQIAMGLFLPVALVGCKKSPAPESSAVQSGIPVPAPVKADPSSKGFYLDAIEELEIVAPPLDKIYCGSIAQAGEEAAARLPFRNTPFSVSLQCKRDITKDGVKSSGDFSHAINGTCFKTEGALNLLCQLFEPQLLKRKAAPGSRIHKDLAEIPPGGAAPIGASWRSPDVIGKDAKIDKQALLKMQQFLSEFMSDKASKVEVVLRDCTIDGVRQGFLFPGKVWDPESN